MPNSEIIRAAKLCSDSYFDRSPQIYDRACDVQGFLKVESGELWIIFQGSKNLKDWISNFSFYQLNYPWETGDNGKVKLHTGFSNCYKSVRAKLHNIIKNSRENRVIFTGHSQGGAIAVIAAVDCQYNFKVEPKLITFGQPRVGNKAYCQSVDRRIEDYRRVVIDRDPVPRLPLKMQGYDHAGSMLLFQKFSRNPHHINNYVMSYE